MLTATQKWAQTHLHSLFILQSHVDTIFKVFYRILFISSTPPFFPVKKTHWEGRNILSSSQMLTAPTPDDPQVLWGHLAEARNADWLNPTLCVVGSAFSGLPLVTGKDQASWPSHTLRWVRVGCYMETKLLSLPPSKKSTRKNSPPSPMWA